MGTFGEKIESLRTGKNLTTKQVAQALGIPQCRYSELETGVRVPTSGQVERMEKYYEVNPGDLALLVAK